MRSELRLGLGGLAGLVGLGVACSSSSTGGGAESLGRATAAITSVPSGVACIVMTGSTPARSVQQKFSVTAGESSVLSLSGMPFGSVTFDADAYADACAAVTASSAASWVSVSPVTVTLSATTSPSFTIDMKPNGTGSVGINFGDDGGTDAATDAAPACDPTTCPTGCCARNVCQLSNEATCGVGGAACSACAAERSCVSGACVADPTSVPEAQGPDNGTNFLLLWLRGDDYFAGASSWTNRSTITGISPATCTSCPTTLPGALNGHQAVYFDGKSTFMNIPGDYYSFASGVTIYVVARMGSSSAYGPVIAFQSGASPSNYARVELNRAGTGSSLVFQTCDTGTTCPYVTGGAWDGTFRSYLALERGGLGYLFDDGAQQASAPVLSPPSVDRRNNFLAYDLYGRFSEASIAEVIVYNTALSDSSRTGIVEPYLKAKYGL